MLVLSRHRDESIIIGGQIEVTVVDIQGDTVRLGISAPREIDVHRKEVFLAIQRENIEAAKANAGDLKNLAGQLNKQLQANKGDKGKFIK